MWRERKTVYLLVHRFASKKCTSIDVFVVVKVRVVEDTLLEQQELKKGWG